MRAIIHLLVGERNTSLLEDELVSVGVYDVLRFETVVYDAGVGRHLNGGHSPSCFAGRILEHHETVAAHTEGELLGILYCGFAVIGRSARLVIVFERHRWLILQGFVLG